MSHLSSRILILTTYYKQGYGVSHVIEKQVTLLKNRGIQNISIGTFEADSNLSHSSEVEILPRDYQQISKAVARLSPGFIIAHTPPFFSLVAQMNIDAIKIAYDHGEPSPFFFRESRRERERINSLKYQSILRFDAHVAISEFIHKQSGISNSHILYNGVDHLEIEKIAENGKVNRSSKYKGKFVIGTLTRIGEGESNYKGYHLFRELKRYMATCYPQLGTVSYLMMGRCVDKSENIVRDLGGDGIDVYCNVSEVDKISLLKTCDIFVSTSLWEGFNLPLTEAQSLATASIAFSVAAHPEVCPYHFNSIQEMASFISCCYMDRDYLQSVARKCEDHVSQFTWANNVEGLIEVLNQVALGQMGVERSSRIRSFISNYDGDSRERIQTFLSKSGLESQIWNSRPFIQRVRYPISDSKVSILIPNKDHYEDIKTCIDSILSKSTYSNYEIVILENGSQDQKVLSFYKQLNSHEKVRVITWSNEFNYSSINNYGVQNIDSDIIIFLNNDTEVINEDWIESMLEHAQRIEVGAVGAKLYFPDKTIQHAGVAIGINGVAGNIYSGADGKSEGYLNRLITVQNVSAVTAACMMMRKDVFLEVGGFDELFKVAFNDVDLCMKIRDRGYRIVWTPYAELFHHEMKTRGANNSAEKIALHQKEVTIFKGKWKQQLKKGDPYYNRNFSYTDTGYNLRNN